MDVGLEGVGLAGEGGEDELIEICEGGEEEQFDPNDEDADMLMAEEGEASVSEADPADGY